MKGRIHIPIAEWVDVQWSHLNADEIEYKLECSKEFTIIVNGEKTLLTPGVHRFTLVRILETDIFT